MRVGRVIRGGSRWACTVVAILLLMLGALSAYYRMHCWWSSGATEVRVGADVGCVYILVMKNGPPSPSTARMGCAAAHEANLPFYLWAWRWPWNRLTPVTGTAWQLAIPFWVAFAPFGTAAALLWRRRWLAQRLSDWSCQECGYDRRGLASPGVACPECGATPAQKEEHATIL